jgi:predicted alternative tryptophan synthase beta-subunit
MNITLQEVADRLQSKNVVGAEFYELAAAVRAHLAKAGKPACYVRAHALERLNDQNRIWHGNYAVALTLDPQDADDVPLYAAPPVAEPAQPGETTE